MNNFFLDDVSSAKYSHRKKHLHKTVKKPILKDLPSNVVNQSKSVSI